MSVKSTFSSSVIAENRENDAPTLKKSQNAQSESKQSNSNLLQRVAARLSRVEEKFSHFPVIENYMQNNKMPTSTLEEKFKFIEFAGAKLNEQALNTNKSSMLIIEDSVSMIEKQLFNNANYSKDDLRNRILRIGSFQESNYKIIKQQINNLISDPNISIDVMKQFLTNISNNLNTQIQIPNNDSDNIETLKNITKVLYSPQSSIEVLRDSLRKSLSLQQNSHTKIQELQRKSQYLEEQLRIVSDSSFFTETRDYSNNYTKRGYVGSYTNSNMRPQVRNTSSSPSTFSNNQSSPRWNASPRKSRTFDLDDDSEMDSFALREAFEPEIKDQYQDHLEMMNAQLRSHGMSRRDIETANEIFKDCFIDLRSKILVQQDAISSLEKDKMQAISVRDKLAQQEAMIRKLQSTLKESIKENPEYKKQLKTIQLLTIKLNQAKNKIVFNQENMAKIKNQLQEKEDQRKRTETENTNLKKEIEMINKALEISSIDAENMKNLEIKSKGIKGLLEKLKKTEQMLEEQQEKMFNMHNLIVKLRNKLKSNGIQTQDDQEIESYIQNYRKRPSAVNEAASYTASFNDHSIVIDDDNVSACSQNQQFQRNYGDGKTQQNMQFARDQNVSKKSVIYSQQAANNNNSIGSNNEISNNNGSSGDENEKIKYIYLSSNQEESNINTLRSENDRLDGTLSQKEVEIQKLNTHQDENGHYEKEHYEQEIRNIAIKQSSQFANVESKFKKLQSETETKLASMTKKIVGICEGFKSFISIHNGLGSSSPKDRKTIEELSQLLHVANNTITTLSKEKDSLLKILCSETVHTKISEDKTGKDSLTKNSSTDRFQLNLQQIDEQVTYQLDDVKNVKSSILNENQKESL